MIKADFCTTAGTTPKSIIWVFSAALLSLATSAFPQPVTDLAAPLPAAPTDPSAERFTDSQLQTLLAPIALYPDALLAQILPASTYPLQVVIAARFLQANPHPTDAQIDAQDLEPSLKALLHYPAVLAMMNDQLLWMQTLGAAFLNQQSDVMNAIQELRQQARNAGTLNNTPQQQVLVDDDNIEIVPAHPDQIYIPEYDAQAIYEGNVAGLSFGVGYPEGLWLDNNFDWHHHWLAGGDGWHHGWDNPIGDARRGGQPPLTRPWERNSAQPIPVRSPGVVREIQPRAAPGYESPGAVREAPAAFGGYENRGGVQREQERAQESRSQPSFQQPRPAEPARQEQQMRPAQVFHAEGSGASVQAQSARGHASRAASSGGGGGGRRR